jgi:glutamyl-tRNA synthetase
MPEPVRVRFAPSPTGLLHIGGLRTALYNFLYARKRGGTFILRIEDTDQSRYVPEAEPDIRASLAWAGLDIDEGPQEGGEVGPYYQSERRELYAKYADQLVQSGHAYYAFDTTEALDDMKERLKRSGNPSPKYDAVTRMSMKNSITLPDAEVRERLAAGEEHVIRLKVPRGETVRFEDQIRGWVSFETRGIDDQVLVKSDGMPTYHLANVVDDHLMGITHVIRGEEWLSSVPKHILLYQYFGWEPPKLAHLPLILSPTGGKLSKRNADTLGIPVSVAQYREAGYEPQALLNFLAFLGWNPGTEQEVFTLDELVDAFEVERIGKSGVQFSMDKLDWFNQQFLRRMTPAELAERARPYLKREGLEADDAYLREVAALMQDRITKVEELATFARFFYEDPTEYETKGVQKRWKDDSADLVRAYADALEADGAFTTESTDARLREITDAREAGAGRLIHPARLAVSGMSFGPSLFEMLALIGKEAVVRRLRRAADVLG